MRSRIPIRVCIRLSCRDTIRVTRNFTLNAGLRYDLQTFEPGSLQSNPLYAPSGKVPTDLNNFSPRIGFAYSLGDHRALVIRGGGGVFYMPIPAIYASQVANDNGIQQSQLFLDLMVPAQAALFPAYPNALVSCPQGTLVCAPPKSLAGLVTTQISAFAPNFQTPYTEQANLTMQREFGRNVVGTVSYEYVHGLHLLRSLDVNLPAPTITQYPVYNDAGSVFLGMYDVASFTTEQTTQSATCPYPPCINPATEAESATGSHQFLPIGIQQHLQRYDRIAEADNESWNVLPGGIHAWPKRSTMGRTRW